MLKTEMPCDSDDERRCLVVAALADGEPVDPNALEDALNVPAARQYLVDLIALRHAVGLAGALPASQRHERRPLRSVFAWVSAAAAILVSLMAGYVAGQQTSQPLPAPAVETVITIENTSVAPKPTRIISLRPGVNWTETREGK